MWTSLFNHFISYGYISKCIEHFSKNMSLHIGTESDATGEERSQGSKEVWQKDLCLINNHLSPQEAVRTACAVHG